ncbi:TIR domain containing protein [Trema orientale]|uniref:TIR domain containing protein n=1 Tax=Trema orientale TaxID=63057 RepID=A0A2P5E0U6_TREOI|nr:TIR domain containing protein [Trema orientale]
MYFSALEARTLVLVSQVIFIQGYAKRASRPTWMKGLRREVKFRPRFSGQSRNPSISVVIFSENYAFSSWCLDELLHILECKKTYGQIVVPVFYNIDPSHIRNQPDNYAAAFARLEERFQDKVQGWKAALKEASNITGWHSGLYR